MPCSGSRAWPTLSAHTPPGYERVRDSEKCAARLQRVPARDTASTEPADALPAAETEAAAAPLSTAVSTTHEGAAQWLGPAAEDSNGEGAAESTDEAAAADGEAPELKAAASLQKEEEKRRS